MDSLPKVKKYQRLQREAKVRSEIDSRARRPFS